MANIRALLGYSLALRQFPQRMYGLRYISTSGKKRETVSTAIDKEVTKDAVCDVKSGKKNWVSYGYCYTDETEDINTMNVTMFLTISLVMIVGGAIWSYMPEIKHRDWAQREAYLELRRREANGLPLVDRNYLDVSKINLPSDEELGDTEIII